MNNTQIYKIVATAVTALLTCLAIALGLSSCNVTRVVTNESQYVTRGGDQRKPVCDARRHIRGDSNQDR